MLLLVVYINIEGEEQLKGRKMLLNWKEKKSPQKIYLE